jgi:hypothetical protein
MSDRTDLELPETMHIEGDPPEAHEETGERQKTPREITMEAIAAKAETRRQAEMAQAAIYDQDAIEAGLTFESHEQAEEPVEPDERRAAPSQVEQNTQAPAPQTVQHPQTRTITLDGRQFEVTDAQFTELAQLGMVANVALHQYQYAPQQVVQPQPVQRQQAQPLIDPERIRETVKSLQYGGEEAAGEALTKLVSDVVSRMPAQQYIDPNAIVHQAANVARYQAQLAADTQTIRAEFPDVFSDPQRTMLAKLNVDAIRARNVATGRQQSDLDIYREAGDAVYSAIGRSRPGVQAANQPATQAATMAVQHRQDVIERKRAAPRATQVIDRRAPAPVTPARITGSELVDRMRLARGQTSMR